MAAGQTARKLGISPEYALLIYRSYWRFIRDTIESLPIEDSSPDGISSLRTNFNIPYIGKLYTDKDKVQKVINRQNYIKRHVKVKGDKADVQQGSRD